MNSGIVIKVLGNLLVLEGLMMLPAFFIALYHRGTDRIGFIITIILTLAVGLVLSRRKTRSHKIKVKEGLAIVTFGWLLASVFGALPFVISGSIPSIIDAFFETVSGLTTTGATIVTDIEMLPKGILFWRSFTHWIGGMGILVFTVAILPMMGVGGFQIFKAESPGPISDRMVPRIKDTAKILYITYISITLLEIILLMFGGMSLYDASLHTFGTVGTGGFSPKNLSIGAYDSTYIHVVISVFMLLAGTNFSLFYLLYKKKWREVLKNEELRLYVGIVIVATILITLNIFSTSYENFGLALRDALFQTSSIITTTGYGTADFDVWPTFSKSILFLLMFIGGCAGSTGGGIKHIRVLVLLKLIKREISKIFHPRAIIPIKLNGRLIASDMTASITSFFSLYIFIFVMGTILISLEDIGIVSAASAVVASLSNIGPGFDFVGPTRNFSEFSYPSKMVLTFFMLLGRLELFTIVALLAPKQWRNERLY